MKRIFSLFIVAVFFLGSSFSFAGTEVLLSDKSLYLMVEKYNAEKLFEKFEKIGEFDFVRFLESETPLKLEMDLQIDSNVDDFIKREIKILDEVNVADAFERAEIKIYNNDQYIATLEAVVEDTVLSLRLPELYEKYITVDLGKLPELCKKFGVPEEEVKALEVNYKKQEELKTLMALTEEQEKDLRNCIMRCGVTLNSLIKDEYFIRDNNAVVNYDDKMIPCSSLSMEIPQRDVVQIVKALWNEIKNDEKVMKIFEEKLIKFYEFSQNELNMEVELFGIAEKISRIIDEGFLALEMMYGPEYDNGRIVSKIYFEEDYDIIKREFGIRNESTGYSSMMKFMTLNDYYALEVEDFLLEDRVVVVAINFEKISEQSLRIWMDFDEFHRLEMLLSTEKLSENSAVLNWDIRLLQKADLRLQTLMPQNDVESICSVKMVVTQNHKIVKKDLSENEINLNRMDREVLEKEWREHETLIIERAENLIENLFPEIVKM